MGKDDQIQEWEGGILMGRYEKVEKLGQGSYGAVYKAMDLKNNTACALKKQILDCDEEGVPTSTLREISILKELPHPNIVT